MKISLGLNVSTSVDPRKSRGFKKGDRIVARIDKNEWYTGTVTKHGSTLEIDFDTGDEATIEREDFNHVKRMTLDKKSKKPLSDAEAKKLYDTVVEPEKPTKVKAVKNKKFQPGFYYVNTTTHEIESGPYVTNQGNKKVGGDIIVCNFFKTEPTHLKAKA